ncbi:hypothetical protein [uncultured Croceitalea sp.]|uniref:hypothetical protein n=1 Tax=uncultured Croceitalea sp. TaxID=1798908 RepID=UPI0033063080
MKNKFGTSLEKLADSLVLQPNGMVDTHLVWNHEIDSARFSGTHDKEGKTYDYEMVYEANAADNLLTTVEDFSKLGKSKPMEQIWGKLHHTLLKTR